jgi:hypothetical protein
MPPLLEAVLAVLVLHLLFLGYQLTMRVVAVATLLLALALLEAQAGAALEARITWLVQQEGLIQAGVAAAVALVAQAGQAL